ncbi:iron-containing alcohol dehydrogenase [Halorhodospira halophila]|uniref:Iron-containing alcohol dehydrogenase n=1 Tax=Halorhodospira halophila (strain DSM 244 / SL1) TaxID=349124 RepID=A1WTC2_HALHL|nr:iron-containing alcohol dehydrogenase [Halorhodospira halophila]ABM60934.1 iron-containing alcohol dehydrogenase [Halorhodospira halophila SL1]MBK1728592.1 hypothetical protein [Halorhodospira halophila]
MAGAQILQPIHWPRTAHYPGAVERLQPWVKELCPEPGTLVLVTGRNTLAYLAAAQEAVDSLKAQGWRVATVIVTGEPSAEWVDEQRQGIPAGGSDLVIALGGGSVLDVGKTLAAMACEEGPTRAYLEGVGDRTPSGRRLPWLAVPTTMGTGSEVTHNAVLGQPGLEQGYKKSLRHPHYVADRVVLDARLTASVPRSVVASAGMDAFSQLLESYLAPTSSPLLDGWLVYGLELAGGALPELIRRHGDADLEAQRHDMALAASLSGVALTYTGLGIVHGLIGPLGAVASVPHGAACANVLPPAMAHTLRQARAVGGASRQRVEDRMAAVSGRLGGEARADALVETLEHWRQEARTHAGLVGLSGYGIEPRHLEAVVAKGSNRRNPVALDAEQWRSILEESL